MVSPARQIHRESEGALILLELNGPRLNILQRYVLAESLNEILGQKFRVPFWPDDAWSDSYIHRNERAGVVVAASGIEVSGYSSHPNVGDGSRIFVEECAARAKKEMWSTAGYVDEWSLRNIVALAFLCGRGPSAFEIDKGDKIAHRVYERKCRQIRPCI